MKQNEIYYEISTYNDVRFEIACIVMVRICLDLYKYSLIAESVTADRMITS